LAGRFAVESRPVLSIQRSKGTVRNGSIEAMMPVGSAHQVQRKRMAAATQARTKAIHAIPCTHPPDGDG